LQLEQAFFSKFGAAMGSRPYQRRQLAPSAYRKKLTVEVQRKLQKVFAEPVD
jgi:hypothetical protein